MPTKNERREAARAKAAADRLEQQRRSRRRRRLVVGGIVVAVLAVAAGGWSLLASLVPPAAPPVSGSTSAPPWAAPSDVAARVRAAGLSLLNSEGSALHIHQHLSVSVDGKPIELPADIGVDVATQRLSPLHTHDSSGIVHVESPTARTFRLSQLFTEWGVRLGAAAIGPYVDGQDGMTVVAYVNGLRYRGDLRTLTLKSKQDIAIEVGRGLVPTAPAPFSWPSGY